MFTILSRLNHLIFSYKPFEKDAPKRAKPSWQWENRRIPEYECDKFKCLLEVGLKWFFFEVERYLDDKSELRIDWKLVKRKDITKYQRIGSSPMTFFTDYNSYKYYGWNIGLTEDERYHRIEVKDEDTVSNPILSGTPIPSFIPAEEIFNLLCSYISSLNDIEVIDTRTDIQKAESAGFDRKTSFRNIK